MESLRFVLDQSEIPTHWYNVVADMPNPPLPPLGAAQESAPPLRQKRSGFSMSGRIAVTHRSAPTQVLTKAS